MEKEEILKSLEPMFEKAIKEKLWFWSYYQGMWFSPAELKECHIKGKFIWGAVNWSLRNPIELINQINTQILELIEKKKEIYQRIEKD